MTLHGSLCHQWKNVCVVSGLEKRYRNASSFTYNGIHQPVCHGFIISVYFCASWVLCCPLLLPSCVHAQPAVPSTSALHQLSCPALFLLFFPSLSPSSLLFCSSHHSPQLRFHLASPAPHSLVALVYILILCRVVCWVCSCSTCLPFLAFRSDCFALMVITTISHCLGRDWPMWSPAFHPHITVIMTPKLFPFLPRENPALTTRLMAVCSLWSVRLRSKPTSLSPRFRATSPDLSTWHMVPSFQSASLPCLISLRLVSLQPPCPEWTKPPACWPPAHSIFHPSPLIFSICQYRIPIRILCLNEIFLMTIQLL